MDPLPDSGIKETIITNTFLIQCLTSHIISLLHKWAKGVCLVQNVLPIVNVNRRKFKIKQKGSKHSLF